MCGSSPTSTCDAFFPQSLFLCRSRRSNAALCSREVVRAPCTLISSSNFRSLFFLHSSNFWMLETTSFASLSRGMPRIIFKWRWDIDAKFGSYQQTNLRQTSTPSPGLPFSTPCWCLRKSSPRETCARPSRTWCAFQPNPATPPPCRHHRC